MVHKEKPAKRIIIYLILLIISSLTLVLSNQWPLSQIIVIIILIYLIFEGILKHNHKSILSIAMGFVMLICVLIWILVQKLSLLSPHAIFYFIIAIGMIITGILAYLGYIPKRWL
ncbi:MAG: hypothetical protein QMC87_06210 [Methanothermobacter thermautotrophicus]|jgi:uncharacterized membrane protein YccC|nr:hypothetical protein [Methanothermobacter thermautotrophicus]